MSFGARAVRARAGPSALKRARALAAFEAGAAQARAAPKKKAKPKPKKKAAATKKKKKATPKPRAKAPACTPDEWMRRVGKLPKPAPGLWHGLHAEGGDDDGMPPEVKGTPTHDWWHAGVAASSIDTVTAIDVGPVHLAAVRVCARTGSVLNASLFHLARWRRRTRSDWGYVTGPSGGGDPNRRTRGEPWAMCTPDDARSHGTLDECKDALRECIQRCPDAWQCDLLVVERQKPAIVGGRASAGAASQASVYTRALAQWVQGWWSGAGGACVEMGQTSVHAFYAATDELIAAAGAKGATAKSGAFARAVASNATAADRASSRKRGATGEYRGNKGAATAFLRAQAKVCPRLKACIARERALRKQWGRTLKLDDLADALRMAWVAVHMVRQRPRCMALAPEEERE